MTIAEEDKTLLKYAGLMGHLFVAISGEPGARRKCGEFNTLDEAKQYCGNQPHLMVYSTAGGKRKKWLSCYDADMTKLAEDVTKHNELNPNPQPWPEKRKPS